MCFRSVKRSGHDCVDRGLLLIRKLLNQEFLLVKLKPWFRKSNTTGANSEAGTAYPTETPQFTPGFSVLALLNFNFCVVFCRSWLRFTVIITSLTSY